MGKPLWQMGAAALARAYADGHADPRQVAEDMAARIERLDPGLGAYVALAPDVAAQAAESARRLAAGASRSPLEGVPVAIKDNMAVAGMPAAWGSAVFGQSACVTDELPVARLRAAGAMILGKTNTPEFAVEGYTGNSRFGVTGNPWDPALTPGGSSGGSVAAVAAGLAALGIGTDGGGSIRRPSGHTGLYGLKPGIGSVPRAGGLPQVLLDFEVAGPVARSAQDLRLAYDVMAGPDRRDPVSRRIFGPQDRGDGQGQDLRVLYVETLGDNPCDPAIRERVGAAARTLAAMGHSVTHGDLPVDLDAVNAHWGRFAQIGLARLVETEPRMRSHAGAAYLAMADEGARLSATTLLDGLQSVQRLRADVSALFADWDIVMTPTAAAQPWPAGTPFPMVIDGHTVGPRGHAVFTGWVNAAGHPAVALPAGPDAAGLPVGFQLIGDMGSELLLLDLAEAWEAQTGGWRWPNFALRGAEK